ncbi:MAG: hypothetical protein J6C01_09025 [Lachnospiraceae bacterium]|nr:hypothetical protein [Lachnospiraceae bacterium]
MNLNNEIIELRCKQCKQRLMDYMVTGNDEAVVLQNITLKCWRCKRVLMLKKYTEGMIRMNSVKHTYRI